MPDLTVRAFTTDAATGTEKELARLDSSEFSPDHLDIQVRWCLKQALSKLDQSAVEPPEKARLEISAYLSVNEDESVRPSLHLSLETIQQLAAARAEFDFDPYT